nr:MAG TPA: hypothetical protein [Caudoviricetes sp.]
MPRAEPGASRRSRCSGVWPGVWTAVGLAGRERGRAAHVLSMVSILRACRLLGIWGGGSERPCLAGVLFLLMGEEPGLKPIVAG